MTELEQITELVEIAASVAKALGLTQYNRQVGGLYGGIYYQDITRDTFVLFYSGRNVFDADWQSRCMDYLLTRGDIALHKKGHHWFFEPSIHNRDQIEILCPADEFFARAIHELITLDPEAVG